MSADVKGEPLFCATDAARALGYSNPQKAIRDHCKGVNELDTPTVNQYGATVMQKMKFITEGNLYRLIARSNLPEAEKFESWIFDEVVPSVRKNGGYIQASVKDTPEEIMAKAVILANKTIEHQKQRIQELAQENAQKRLLIEEQKPKVLFADAVATAKQSCLVGELAKILKQNGVEIGQNRMFTWLRDNEYLGKTGAYYNIPTQKSMDLGLFELKKTTVNKPDGSILVTTTTKVTGKGQQYFINKFLGGR
ncbi:MAG: phage antirepressor KilAC domain-containing protein [Bacteroidales bacterium]|nr:phage antirepressor KilAC domain-containing protein [Bacteroidales bacterium]